jgi:hypothetical protein
MIIAGKHTITNQRLHGTVLHRTIGARLQQYEARGCRLAAQSWIQSHHAPL